MELNLPRAILYTSHQLHQHYHVGNKWSKNVDKSPHHPASLGLSLSRAILYTSHQLHQHYYVGNKWSRNVDERPHHPRTCHPVAGEFVINPRFRHDALSPAHKYAAPCCCGRLLLTQSNAFQWGKTPKTDPWLDRVNIICKAHYSRAICGSLGPPKFMSDRSIGYNFCQPLPVILTNHSRVSHANMAHVAKSHPTTNLHVDRHSGFKAYNADNLQCLFISLG